MATKIFWRGFHQGAAKLHEHPFWCQRIQFSTFRHGTHLCKSFIGDLEVQSVKTCRKARNPQHAQWVFAESGRHVPQQPRLQIMPPAKWVDQISGFALRHRIDGQIPPT